MVWAEYGFSSNLRLEDFASERSIFATHKDGELLTAEHGFPLRLVVPQLYAWKGPKWVRGVEYMTADRRGFWEERGYHNVGDPWREQRYSYQEEPGDGPEALTVPGPAVSPGRWWYCLVSGGTGAPRRGPCRDRSSTC